MGDGDVTSVATVPAAARARGRLLAKEELVVCGVPILDRVYARLGGAAVTPLRREGELVPSGTVVATVEGGARTLLAGERLALNLVQHLAGIATLTRRVVGSAEGTKLIVRDTRKTAPGLRRLAKYAVRMGGGTNHRMRLDDAFLIKDNHLTLGRGDLAGAVAKARTMRPDLPLELEVRTLDELRVALGAGPDLILLDNMSLAEMTEAVRLAGGRVPLEASGGITLEDVPAVAATGVDFVAIGQLTHSAGAADLSLKLEPA